MDRNMNAAEYTALYIRAIVFYFRKSKNHHYEK